jgi:hypothetical protein
MMQVIPVDTDLSAPFHAQNEMDCLFIQRLALFFCNFFKLHLGVRGMMMVMVMMLRSWFGSSLCAGEVRGNDDDVTFFLEDNDGDDEDEDEDDDDVFSSMQVLEVPECHEQLVIGMFYLVRISEVPDEEVFKICLDYW